MPKLTPIIGQPNYTNLLGLRRELHTNARSVHSHRGGGNHGHLGLVMDPEAYIARTGVPFDLPPYPGEEPTPTGTTAAQITSDARHKFNDIRAELATAQRVDSGLRKQLLTAMHHDFISPLATPDDGFADVTVPQFLAHLFKRYGTITRSQLEANCSSIQTAWNMDEPISVLWTRLRIIREIAEAGQEPLADVTLMELTFNMFLTGVHQLATQGWARINKDEKIWEKFVDHFTWEEDHRKEDLLKAGHEYSSNANSVVTQAAGGTMMFYCWSHGATFSPGHTSGTCRNRADGHCPEATLANTMGGCQTIYKPPKKPPARDQRRGPAPAAPTG